MDWFCQYRKFWSLNFIPNEELSFHKFKNEVLREIPDKFKNYDVILGEPFFVNKRKTMKFLKKGFPLDNF